MQDIRTVFLSITGPDAIRNQDVGDSHGIQDGIIIIEALRLPDIRDSLGIAIHELVEVYLCEEAGIAESVLTDFDATWEPHDGIEEPGLDPACPYHVQHVAALQAERAFMEALGIDWDTHDAAVIAAYDARQEE